MTELQQDILSKLLLGYNIVGNEKYGYRLRTPDHQVSAKISYRTFYPLKKLLRKNKGLFVINKSKVRQLHGNCFTKKQYKSLTQKSLQ
jgi:hypothetical protein